MTCPFELAWVDAPNSKGLNHQYQECAGVGICDRSTGTCNCMPGYEGKACKRAVCPNLCSGHGHCKYMDELAFGTVFGDWAFNHGNVLGQVGAKVTDSDNSWDGDRQRACVCDAGWSGIDCTSRMCPNGNDAMFVSQYKQTTDYAVQVQTITLIPKDDHSPFNSTFALTFTSRTNQTFTTVPIMLSDAATLQTDVVTALTGLPNLVIDAVTATATLVSGTYTIAVSFTGSSVQGRQNLLELDVNPCAAGCTPLVTGLVQKIDILASTITESTAAAFNTYECGRRGKCDYTTGTCTCFAGYTGNACSTITALV